MSMKSNVLHNNQLSCCTRDLNSPCHNVPRHTSGFGILLPSIGRKFLEVPFIMKTNSLKSLHRHTDVITLLAKCATMLAAKTLGRYRFLAIHTDLRHQ